MTTHPHDALDESGELPCGRDRRLPDRDILEGDHKPIWRRRRRKEVNEQEEEKESVVR